MTQDLTIYLVTDNGEAIPVPNEKADALLVAAKSPELALKIAKAYAANDFQRDRLFWGTLNAPVIFVRNLVTGNFW